MYSICSISKLFTTVSAMQLREEGKFRLDDPVSALLPWFELDNSFADAPTVTVEGLMTHSAGLPRESDYPYWTAPFDFPSHDQIVSQIANQETLYPAWQYFQYSNLGVTLVGEIVATLSGQSYDDYVREHVLEPLQMFSTTPEIGEVQGTDKLATGYGFTRRGGGREKVEPFEGRGIAPAMGFASTVEDLAKFASWQFRLLKGRRARDPPRKYPPGDAARALCGPRLGNDLGPRLQRVASGRQDLRGARRELPGGTAPVFSFSWTTRSPRSPWQTP